MREVERIRRDRFTTLAEIPFDALFHWTHRAIDLIRTWMRVVIDLLGVEVGTSAPVFVNVHAASRLNPMTMFGAPGHAMDVSTLLTRCASYQMEGSEGRMRVAGEQRVARRRQLADTARVLAIVLGGSSAWSSRPSRRKNASVAATIIAALVSGAGAGSG
jgi:hypothetical protein